MDRQVPIRVSLIESTRRDLTTLENLPVPTIGGSIVGYYEMVPVLEGIEPWFASYIPWRVRMRNITPAGAFDQKEAPGFVGARPPYLSLASRSDVLLFQTGPLEEPVEVTGTVTVRLWISSSAPDTDFTAKLVDVHPDGRSYNICDGIVRARTQHVIPLVAGAAYSLTVDLVATSILLSPGHRLQLQVSSSNFPMFEANANTGNPTGTDAEDDLRSAAQVVHHDATHPSCVVLPVIPR